MAKAAIPIDVHNPGQVFASVGFLELADVLLGPARGGFVWESPGRPRFELEASGGENPFACVLEFLSNAEIREVVPASSSDPEGPNGLDAANGGTISSQRFPTGWPQDTAHPIRLQRGGTVFDVTHWADGSSRRRFKLYSGNRSALHIASAMVRGVRERPRRNQAIGSLRFHGIKTLWEMYGMQLAHDPFGRVTPMGGSFNFDPRGGWSSLDAGYSPNAQSHGVQASPVVEMLAAIGLEYARPEDLGDGLTQYAIWCGLSPPLLARPALAGVPVGLALRTFRFVMGESGKNKIVTFAQEVLSQ